MQTILSATIFSDGLFANRASAQAPPGMTANRNDGSTFPGKPRAA
jgi:hypothetical protein